MKNSEGYCPSSPENELSLKLKFCDSEYKLGVDYQGKELSKYINLIDLLTNFDFDEHDIGQKEGSYTPVNWHEVKV